MLTRHDQMLTSRLDEVADLGCVVIRKTELKRWYEIQRFTKGIWRKVYDKWRTIDEKEPLLIAEGDGFFTLIYGRGLITSDNSWFRDIRVWAEISDE